MIKNSNVSASIRNIGIGKHFVIMVKNAVFSSIKDVQKLRHAILNYISYRSPPHYEIITSQKPCHPPTPKTVTLFMDGSIIKRLCAFFWQADIMDP